MEKFKDLKTRLERELEDQNRKSTWSASDVEAIKNLTHSIKNICRINEMAEDEDGGEYSGARRGRYYRDGGYSGYPMYMGAYPMDDGYMGDDYNMRRGQRRDSMGRYSRHDEHMTREDMISEMRRMLGEATAEKDRNAIMSAINSMEK